MKRLRWLLNLALAVIVTSVAGWPAGAGGGDQVPASRDAVWRSIFARPKAADKNPENELRVELGAALFADKRLSRDGARACVSCHEPARAFTDGLARAKARNGSALKRNTPSLYNLAWSTHFFADGRAASFEDQARFPLTAPDEMAGDFATIVQQLRSAPQLAAQFANAYPASPDVSETSILASLAAYERKLISPQTRFDRWVEGDDNVLTPQERDGFTLFVGKGGCVGCHGGWRRWTLYGMSPPPRAGEE